MSLIHTIATLGVACVLTTACATAPTPAEHKQHHPEASASKPAPPAAPSSVTKEAMHAMDGSMKKMHDMHGKMMAAKTPDERKALMADHMKAMQDGMAMMDKMKNTSGGDGKSMDMASHHQMMEKRMDMMTSMMKMMMDRMPETPAK